MALKLCDVQRDPIANRALEELAHRYIVAEEKSCLVLTKKAGNMKLFFNDLGELHQWDFFQNQKMVKENERLRVFSRMLHEQRESWKHVPWWRSRNWSMPKPATMVAIRTSATWGTLRSSGIWQSSSILITPPGHGIEKIVRNELIKEIWSEIDRLDHQEVSATCSVKVQWSLLT